MRYNKIDNILHALMAANDYKTSKELADEWNTSEKTILKYLNILKYEVADHGAVLDIRHGTGTKLIVKDPAVFNAYLAEFSSEEKGILNNPQTRKAYVLMRLLTNGDYISLYDLADELYISPSLLRNIIRSLKETAEQYNLQLENSHQNGYRIIGKEIDIRHCLTRECKDESAMSSVLVGAKFNDSQISSVTNIVSKSLQYYGISLSDKGISALVLHIMIAINRIETDNTVSMPDEFALMQLKGSPEYFVANRINRELKETLGISLPENELMYLTLHINGKQRFVSHHKIQFKVTEEDIIFYNRFLRNIYKYSDVDLFEDEELRIALLNHIIPFRNRVNNNLQITKSEMADIQNEFPYAYELALYGLSMFKEGQITPAEISYFALHLELSLEKNKQAEVQYNIGIICKDVATIYHIASFKLDRDLHDLIGSLSFIKVSDLERIQSASSNNYDLILNMTDIPVNIPVKTLSISNFITEDEMSLIRNTLQGLSSEQKITSLCDPALFMNLSDVHTQKEVLDQMVAQIKKTVSLPDDFMDRVLSREKLGSTEFDNGIAIPHPLDTSKIPDFLAIAKLKEPVVWNKKEVSLVFLLSASSAANSSWFMDHISKVIQSSAAVQALVSAKDYHSFMMIFMQL
jgi:Transcriptional antiterminator